MADDQQVTCCYINLSSYDCRLNQSDIKSYGYQNLLHIIMSETIMAITVSS